MLASSLAKRKIDVIVFEEHADVGLPDHCAGLVNIENFKKIYGVNQKIIKNTIKGTIIRYGDGQFNLSRNKDEALVIDRPLFDRSLAHKASKNGADIKLNQAVKTIIRKDNVLNILTDRGEIFKGAKLVVNAAGVKALLSRNFNLNNVCRNPVPALQYDLSPIRDVVRSHVELYFNNDLTPGFFSWVIPLNEDTARVGLASNEADLKLRLKYFIKKTSFNTKRFEKAKITKIRTGLIITGGPAKKTYGNGQLLIGDAAGQVKPTTGGGIVTGGICAKIADGIISKSVEDNNFSEVSLSRYQLGWKGTLSKEFRYMMYIRNILNSLDNKSLMKFFKIIAGSQIAGVLEDKGDIDFQASAVESTLKRPETLKLLPIITLAFIRYLLL